MDFFSILEKMNIQITINISARILLVLLLWRAPYIAYPATINAHDSLNKINNTGAHFFFNGDYEKAEEYFLLYLKSALGVYPKNDINIADGYNNLGVLNIYKWRYEIALEYFNKAAGIYQNYDHMHTSIAIVYSNIGKIYREIGDYTHAEEYYEKALELLNKSSSEEIIQRKAELLNGFAILNLYKREYQKAAEHILLAISEYEKKSAKSPITYNNLYNTAAEVFDKLDQQDKTNYYLLESIKVLEGNELSFAKQLFESYKLLTLHYIKMDAHGQVKQSLIKTIQLFRDYSIDTTFYLDIIQLQAQFAEYQRNYESANSFYAEAISRVYKDSDSLNNRNFPNLKAISLRKNRAKNLLNWYDTINKPRHIHDALIELKILSKIIDQSRNSYLSIESKLLLAENESEVYEMGFSCAYQLFEITKNDKYLNDAFYFAEKGKSSVLSGAITEERAKSFANIPAHLIQKEQALKRELAFYNEKIYTENTKRKPDTIKLATWKNYLFDYSRENEELKQLLERQYPAYFKLKYKDTFTGISRIQKKLDRSTTLIEYTLTDSILYTFVINKNEIYLYKSPCKDSLKKNIRNFVASFNQFDFTSQGANTYRDYENQSHTIYKSLLGFIPDDILKKNLVIIPDGILSYIPFEALVIKKNKTAPESFAAMNYLVLNHPVYYSYSAGLYVDAIDHTSRKFRNETLAVAPEYNYKPRGTIKYTHNNEAPPVRNSLHPLPHALKEVELVAELTNGDVISGKEATEPYFVKEAPRYDVLHLAMHTLIDDNNPLYSKLVFYNKEYTSDAGLLTTNEIFALRLKAKLTVLSACSSGEGEYNKGEGVMSLSRGFFYAGCPSLIMTLWKVEDKSGQLLMKAYYKYLIKGYFKICCFAKSKKRIHPTSHGTK
jgi:CHAT domain-containing protein